jgi:hypothetical protein
MRNNTSAYINVTLSSVYGKLPQKIKDLTISRALM